MTERVGRSVVIVGGGASGVIMAAHLLRSDAAVRVVLIERRSGFGQGIAYSTSLPDHLLNVSAMGMSALADDPQHYWRWLETRGLAGDGTTPIYTPRSTYGQYLGELLAELGSAFDGRFRLINEEAISITPASSGVAVELANGSSIIAHAVVLALGHDQEPAPAQSYATRIGSPDDTPIDPNSTVLILGTGLSMVDAYLTLENRGHSGPIIAVSRRGLLPFPHQPGRPLRLDRADIPLGTELSYFVRWFRDLERDTTRAGGNWRDVVDGLRPFNQLIWQNWPLSAKRRFVEHTRAWWDIHRHRMAPQIHARLIEAINDGRLRLLAGRVSGVQEIPAGFEAELRQRGTTDTHTLTVRRIYDCTGLSKDVSEGSIGIVRSLIERRLARRDPLRLGLDVTKDCAVIDAAGSASDKLYAVGPLTRGTFFEIDAVPDIRAQCARLARDLSA